ncbi:phosphatase PAP2 family protein [Acetobacter orientalis]|uniref:phosphatase PAP2 family protein n=1 Tax=Acetobacter orientalis TaxID=146474 RepID=UPI00386D226C
MLSNKNIFAQFISGFGDQAVVIPLCFIIFSLFYFVGWRRGAVIWFSCIGVTLAIIVVAKVIGLLWGEWYVSNDRAFSLSGHVAASVVVYGTLLNLFTFRHCKLWFQAVRLPLCIAVFMGYARLELHAHTYAEVIMGALAGCVGSVLVMRCLPIFPLFLKYLGAACTIITILILHGRESDAERILQNIFHASYIMLHQKIG